MVSNGNVIFAETQQRTELPMRILELQLAPN